MLHEDDFILRAVKRLAEFIARALGLASTQKLEEARRTLHDAAGSVLGLELTTLEVIDAKSAVSLLGDWRRVLAATDLLGALAQIELKAGDAGKARLHVSHALSLLDELQPRAEVDAARVKLVALLVRE
ncbi:MAG: hypothetical protein QM817_20015 [Archangium sp.]